MVEQGRTARGASAELDIVDRAEQGRAGQSSPAQTMVEQRKEEQHRAYITMLHIDIVTYILLECLIY
jgi:hypothetical protein